VGLLVEAFRGNLLPLGELRLLLTEIAARPDIWISAKLCQQVWSSIEGETS